MSWDKTNFIIFHTPRKKANELQELTVDNFTIKRIKVVTYLGMYIDEHMKWDKHINHICTRLSKNFHMFYTIRNLLTDHLKKQLYYSLVHSRILYGIEVYGSCSSSLLNKIQTLQNKLLKVLYNLPFRTDTNELHSQLKLLKVKDIYNVNVLKFVYESVNDISIVQFRNYFRQQDSIHSYNTRNENVLYPKLTHTKYGDSTLNYVGSQLWNLQERNIKLSSSVHVFKKLLKNKMIISYNIV